MFDLLFGKIKTILSGKEYEFRESSSEETFARQYDFVLLCNYDGNRKIHTFLKDVMSLFDFIIVIDYSDENFLLEPILKEKPFLHIKFKSILDNRELLRLGTILDVEWICLMNANEKFDYRFNKISNYKGRKDIEAVLFSYVQTFDGKYYYVFPESREGVFEEIRMWRKDIIDYNKKGKIVEKGPILLYSKINNESFISEKANLFVKSYDKQGLYFKNYCFRNYEEISNIELERIIRNRLSVIGEYFLSKQVENLDIGLYTGNSGVILFLAQYYLWNNDIRYLKRMNEYLDCLQNLLEERVYEMSGSFCSGVAGYCWLLCYLQEFELINFAEDYFDDLDKILESQIEKLERVGYIDQMYGLISIGRYFLKRNKKDKVERILKYMNECAEFSNNEVKWSYASSYKVTYNFGLAHGMAGILYFILKCYQKKVCPELCLEMGNGIVRFYEHNEQNYEIIGFYYPYKIYKEFYGIMRNEERSRYAWCFGDICILYSLFLYAVNISDLNLQRITLDKLRKTALKRDCREVKVQDAQFCHGASGVMHLYNRLYFFTKDKVFQDAAMYWSKVVFEEGEYIDKEVKYLFYDSLRQEYINNDTLINGLCGVGLTLLSILDYSHINWDEAMMLY